MSEFTKEELRHLDYSLEQFRFSCINPNFENELNELRTKIQSMIDNYCEHDSCKIDYDHQPIRCNKCLEIVE